MNWIILILLLLVGSPAHAYNYCGDAVGCWLFTEGSGTTISDSSGNVNTGAYSGDAPTWLTDDVEFNINGSAPYNFYSAINGGINIGMTSFNDTSISVTSWVKMYGSLAADKTVISKGYDGTKTAWQLKTYNSSGHMLFGGYRSGTIVGVASTGVNVVSNTEFTFVAGTVTGVTWTVYVNGVGQSQNSTYGAQITDRPVQISSVATTTTPDYFQNLFGYISETSLFEDVLSSTDISAIYDYGLQGQQSTGTYSIIRNSIIRNSIIR